MVCSAAALALLLVLRSVWKKSGKMERAYIDGFAGWKHWALLLGKWALTALIVWQILCILGGAAYYLFAPSSPLCVLDYGAVWTTAVLMKG